MAESFQKIGLFAKHNNQSVTDTFEKLIFFLEKRGHSLILEEECSALLTQPHFPLAKREAIGKQCDLVIVVGGDGSLLNAARAVVSAKVPVLGINRGSLGFLADILPGEMEKELTAILEGHYTTERRFLLEATIKYPAELPASLWPTTTETALNDVVFYCGNLARMVEFEIYINDQFVLRQQADGIITATPTGSTAYALSAGGPILYPTLEVITIAPLCPHTLSSRPIVVNNTSHIKLIVTQNNTSIPKLSCDGQSHFELPPGSEVSIHKHEFELILIHPIHHDYFSVLREKLGWNT
jgi:NAD+ kinase